MRSLFAILVAITLSAAATGAVARGGHAASHAGHGSWHGTHVGAAHFARRRHGRVLFVPRYAGPYYSPCYQLRRVPTVHGWRWRRVWVCG